MRDFLLGGARRLGAVTLTLPPTLTLTLTLTPTLTLTLALTPTLTLALTLAATKQLRERCPFADMKLCKETLRDYGCDVGLAAEALEANRVDRV